MNRAYIARRVTPDEYCFRRHLEEGAFDSFEEAEKYVKSLVEEARTDDLSDRLIPNVHDTFLEIVSYAVNDPEPRKEERCWCFDEEGRLIKGPQEDKAGSSPAFFSPESFTGKYKVGDIVFVRALPWNDASHFEVDHIGVIGWRPISSHEWTKKGERKEDWVGDYVVEFINSDGFLDHDHVVEQGIEPYQGDLPEAQGFLKILSDHYLGKRKIRESLLQDLYESRIFVRKVRQFNEDCFEQETKA